MEEEEEQKQDQRMETLDMLLNSLRWTETFVYGRDLIPESNEIPEFNDNPSVILPLNELGLKYKKRGMTTKLQSYLKRFRC